MHATACWPRQRRVPRCGGQLSQRVHGRARCAPWLALDPSEPSAGDPEALSEIGTQVLAFETHWWKYADAKEAAIRERFDMSSTGYYQVLDALTNKPAAHAAAPLLAASSASPARGATAAAGHRPAPPQTSRPAPRRPSQWPTCPGMHVMMNAPGHENFMASPGHEHVMNSPGHQRMMD